MANVNDEAGAHLLDESGAAVLDESSASGTQVTLTAVFSTPGAFSWTCPPGVTAVTVVCWGGGGAGGHAGATTGSNGGGGGGGEVACEPALAVTPSLAYSGAVGAGGPGPGAGVQPGTASTFTGDAVTVTAHGGGGGGTSTTGSGAGGAGGGGSVNAVSAAGGAGGLGTVSTNGGGGGGAAGASAATGFPGSPGAGSTAGAASAGTFAGGAGGAGSTSGAGPGSNGSAPGGGGGGALSTGTGRNGGNGGNGQVTITWTQSDPVTLTANTTAGGGSWTFTAPFGATAVNAQAWGAGGGGYQVPGGIPGAGPVLQGNAGAMIWQVYGQTSGQRVSVANIFDGYVGVPMALASQKVLYNETGSDSIAQFANVNSPQQVGDLAAAGCFVIMGPWPSRTWNQAGGVDDFAALQSALATVKSTIGAANFAVMLCQECNLKDKAGVFKFAAAADYVAYMDHYSPAIPSDVKLFLCVGMAQATRAVQFAQAAMASTVRKPDHIGADWYGSEWVNGNFLTYPTSDPNYPGIADVADNAGVPFGIYEYGGSSSGSFFPTQAQWDGYISGANGVATLLSNRIAAGKPVSYFDYYGGTGPGKNDIESGTDFRIPGINAVWNAYTAAGGASGGAGGGGGEFAQESALAITDSQQYVISIGQGNPLISGGNTTIAGDSATVTAHGGSAATALTAGGAGGTGSGNTTHHAGGGGGAGGVTNGGGGGGGSSGGTGAGGNAGGAGTQTTGGAAGAAVTGGGKGGFGGGPSASGQPGVSPGGGGGGGGASGINVGDAADGQVILTGFVAGVAGPASYGLAPLAMSGSAFVGSSSGAYTIAPPAISAQANVSMFSFVQKGSTTSGGTYTIPGPSTAGTMLTAVIAQTTQAAATPPAGWILAGFANAGGTTGRIERWYLPPEANPGGITSAAFTVGTNGRGFLAEFKPPPGYTVALDGTPGTNSGTTATTLPVTTSGASAGGDLGLVAFETQYSPTGTSQSWPTPAGWTLGASATAVADNYASYYQLGLPAGTQAVTGTFSAGSGGTQTGWAALLCVFTAIPLGTSTGALALAPVAFSGQASTTVGGGLVQSNAVYNLAPLAFQSPSQATTFPADPLPVRVEIFVNDVWADITSYVYVRDSITISSRGRPDEASTAQPAQVTFTLNNRDGSFSPANTAGQFYPYLTRNTQVRISVVNAVTATGSWYNGVRFWGEIPAWPLQWIPDGSDVYATITAAGVLQRMRQSRKAQSPLARYYSNLVNVFVHSTGGGTGIAGGFSNSLVPAGYWACEDGSSSAFFASGLPGGSPMTWSGTPGLSADSNVPGSAPFAQLSSSAWTGTPGAFSSGGQTFTTPGTFTWSCPAGITSILAECWGAGGGGGNGAGGNGGAGGGGGEYAAEPALAVTPGNTYTFVIGAGGSGGPGSFSTRGTGGTAGAATTFTGDSKVVTAHGGGGGSGGGSKGSGGSGSSNTTHHPGGNGAAASGHFGGSGGGSSAGNGASGNNGSGSSGTPGGNGGNAPTAGGPGGAGGQGATASQGNAATPGLMPSPGPGGGGGGGGYGSYNNYGKPGGGGQAGQVRVSFGTQTPAPAAIVLRAVIDVPSGGGTDGATYVQALAGGAVANLSIIYHTASGGSFALTGKNAGGSQVFTSGTKTFGCNGQPMLVSGELVQNGATQIAWKLTAITPGATSAVATFTGTVSGTLGSVTEVLTNSGSPVETLAVGIGHVSVQYAVDPIVHLSGALAAYSGELAATRFARLCGEQRVPAVLIGNAGDTPQMGPQPVAQLTDLLQDCETADLGQMFETRGAFGLTYCTRAAMQSQSPAVILDYTAAQLAPPLTPTNDDSLTRNDILVQRSNGSASGSSYEATQFTGPLSVQDPPAGVGYYTFSPTANLYADTQLANYATWLLILGTVDEFRYPTITVNLHRDTIAGTANIPGAQGVYGATYGTTYPGSPAVPGAPSVFYQIAALDITGYLQIVNPPAWLPPGPINQLAFGFTEVLGAKAWTITINAVPEDPYGGSGLPTW